MIIALIIFNVLFGIGCWFYADNFPSGTVGWFLFLTFSAWNGVEAFNGLMAL